MIRLGMVFAAAVLMSVSGGASHAKMTMQTFPVLAGSGPHDVYPAPDGTVWFTAQSAGKLGHLDPRTGKSDLIALGPGAAPHGVIVGWCPLGHRRRAERDRPGRSRDARGEALSAAQGAAARQPQHGQF
jgi:hypothetical protein